MVKGTSKQVIVVQSPDPKLFEQAIFILREEAVRQGGISEEALLREANMLIRKKEGAALKRWQHGPVWACAGALATGLLWLLSRLL